MGALVNVVKGRTAKGADITILTAAVVGITILMNILAVRYPQRWDVTANQQHTLSLQTVQLLSQLKEPIKILVFMKQGEDNPYLRQMRDILESYQGRSPKISYEIVDPEANPTMANEYGVTQANSVVFLRGQKRKAIAAHGVFGEEGAGRPVFQGEQAFTNALLSLLEDKQQIIYFSEGHGELLIDQEGARGAVHVKASLESENRIVKGVNLALVKDVPEDCGLLVIAGPRKPVVPRVVDMVKRYVAKGGKLIMAYEVMGDPTHLEKAFVEWGVSVARHLVVDPERSPFLRLFPTKLMPLYKTHAITDRLAESRLLMMWDMASPIRLEKLRRPGVIVEPLLETSEKAWGEVQLKQTSLKKDLEDDQGPLVLAVAVSRPLEKEPAAAHSDRGTGGAGASSAEVATKAGGADPPVPVMVVCGDASFLSDENYINAPGNKDFFLNSVSWLLAERVKISIRPKSAELRRVRPLTGEDAAVVLWTSVIGTPLLILGLGAMVWWHRRS